MRTNLSVRINSRTAPAQAGGRKQGAAEYALLSAAANDVDSKKHKKNPFHERYVQLCLTEFGQVSNRQQSERAKPRVACISSLLSTADTAAG